MNNFESVIKDLLDAEGGYVDHPNDNGGATNWGITIGALSDWRGRKVTKAEVKALTIQEAKAIYKAKYWDSINLDKINNLLIADLVFDQSVNRGPVTAAKNLQESYNNVYGKGKLTIDGKIGAMTVAAINTADQIKLAIAFFKDAQLDYATIVANNASQRVFMRGWTNRTHKLLDRIILAIKAELVCAVQEGGPKADAQLSEILGDLFDYFFGTKPAEETKPVVSEEADLAELIVKNNPLIDKNEIERALGFLSNKMITKKDHMLYVDFDLHSKDERAYLLDLKTGKSVMKEHTTVGKYSDLDHNGFATDFGNVPGSGKSSLGAMASAEQYGKSVGGGSKFTYAQRLDGLEPGLNDKVRSRLIVIHNSNYSETGGRSLGCITFDDAATVKIMDYLKKGSLVYVNHESLFA